MSRKTKANNVFCDSLISNIVNSSDYLTKLLELSCSSVRWVGFPNSVDTRSLELYLNIYGRCAIFMDDVAGLMCLPFTDAGRFDPNGNPTRVRAYSPYDSHNKYNKTLYPGEFVCIYNNFTRTNSVLTLQRYAQKLHHIDSVMSINLNAQKTPVFIACDNNDKLTMINVYKNYEGNAPVIFGKKWLANSNPIQVLKTDAPYLCGNLQELREKTWHDALEFIGVCSSYEKKERRITSEVEAEGASANGILLGKLEIRNNACKFIKEFFGVDVFAEVGALM